jgi:hypothetical protein
MNSIHWVLVAIAVFTLMSVGKLAAGFMLLVVIIAVLARYARSISIVFNRLFRGE